MTRLIGMGSPLLDITLPVEESFLKQHGLAKGTMTLVTKEQQEELLIEIQQKETDKHMGGSVSNVLVAASMQGTHTTFIGCIGDDSLGTLYEEQVKSAGITAELQKSTEPQGTCLALIPPDGERTFATYLGAAIDYDKDRFPLQTLEDANILHVEGYYLDGEKTRETLLKILPYLEEKNIALSLDLSDPGVVERHKALLEKLLPKVTYLFANETEAKAYTGKEELQAAHELTQTDNMVCIVKVGAKGSYIVRGTEEIFVQGTPVDVVNTNGAGDAYAGVFLSSIISGKTLQEAGKLASLAGAQVVSQPQGTLSTPIKEV